jgi:hypothetical protein
VLQVISSSPGDLGVVFQKMLEKATRACDAKFGTMYLFEGGAFRNVALHNAPAAFAEERRRNPVLRPNPGTGLGRVASTHFENLINAPRAVSPACPYSSAAM